jgi:mRNA interferase RelE/StbE
VSYAVQFSHEAEKTFARLDRRMQLRVIEKIELLAENPFQPHTSKPLKGDSQLRSSRLGGWRILFRVRETAMEIVAIRPRGSAYRDI